ncbi:hypothetical protein, partial [Fibrobacter sp.]
MGKPVALEASAERIFVVYEAFRRGWSIEKLYETTK